MRSTKIVFPILLAALVLSPALSLPAQEKDQDKDFTGASWQTYGTAPSFAVSSSIGTKTIYFKLKNGFGESSIVSDTINKI